MVYAVLMTLSKRNDFFKAGIFISSAALITIVIVFCITLPAYSRINTETVRRSSGLLSSLMLPFFKPVFYAPFVSIAGSAVYAFITMALIYYFFEKTQSPEILFFAFFVLSFAFEGIRIMVPLKIIYELPNVYLVVNNRILLFARYFGFFSLFTASLYASGLEVQKQRNIIFVIAVAALMIALGIPIDGLSWDSSLNMTSGYPSMFGMVEISITFITMISFFISAYSRGTREYILIGLGSFLVFMGRNILFNADTWIAPFPGLVILGIGTWFICTQLHRVYLWF
ncbi:MAG: hypothetical protein LBT93_05230 [Treponema sp.]|jgi:hypothetical protein|nr:hypothetical protein [Treponema sp.]